MSDKYRECLKTMLPILSFKLANPLIWDCYMGNLSLLSESQDIFLNECNSISTSILPPYMHRSITERKHMVKTLYIELGNVMIGFHFGDWEFNKQFPTVVHIWLTHMINCWINKYNLLFEMTWYILTVDARVHSISNLQNYIQTFTFRNCTSKSDF